MAAKTVTTLFYDGSDGDDDVVGNGLDQTFGGYRGKDRISGGGGADTIYGGADSDTLHGDAGNDVLFGNMSYEPGTRDADRLYGDAGDDRLTIGTSVLSYGGGTLPAVADGGADSDVAVITVEAYDGSTDRPVVFALSSAAAGSSLTIGGKATLLVKNVERVEIRNDKGDAADRLTGGAGADTLLSGGGDDVLRGLAGDDVLDGGTGKQDIDGGIGFDTASFDLSEATTNLVLRAGGTNQLGAYGRVVGIEKFGTVFTGSGNDTVALGQAGGIVNAGAGNDTVTGGKGVDFVRGGAGADTLTGGDGDDVLYADPEAYLSYNTLGSDDVLSGGAGNDSLSGGDGRDTLDGGTGDDILSYVESAAGKDGIDSFKGGDGTDTLVLDLDGYGANRIEVALAADTAVKIGGRTVLQAHSMEALRLSTDYGAPVSAVGGDEADSFSTGNGNDYLRGLGGDDTIVSRGGADNVDAGAGKDDVSAFLGGRDTIRTGADDDTLTLFAGLGSDAADKAAVYDLGGGTGDVFTLVEYDNSFSGKPAQVYGFDGKALTVDGKAAGTVSGYESFVYKASDYADLGTTLNGTAVADELHMGGGNDTAGGGAGNDRLYGDSGDDTLSGGKGDDFVQGGADSDGLDGGDGIDTLDYSDRSYINDKSAGLTITLTGAKASKVVDTVFDWTDTIKNFENVVGSTQNDTITGDNGANRLAGGGGHDVLKGLGGADTFVFKGSGAFTADRVVDFNTVDDTIALTKTAFAALTGDAKTGVLTGSEFKDVTDASTKLDADDHMLYNRTTGTLSYDADGSGSAVAKVIATFDNHAALTFRDILLV